MADEVTQLGQEQIDREWRSTLTGVEFMFNWDYGWMTRKPGDATFYSYKPGVVTNTVRAHAGEKFIPGSNGGS